MGEAGGNDHSPVMYEPDRCISSNKPLELFSCKYISAGANVMVNMLLNK